MAENQPGSIAWVDLTVPDAERLRDFYAEVVGWRAEPVDMGGYDDFNMLPVGSDQPAAGICFARGVNADVPAQWMVYIVVDDLERSIARCEELGGQVVDRREHLCVVRDPAGAVAALYALK